MFRQADIFFRRLIVFCIPALCLAAFSSVPAQSSQEAEREIPILREITSKPFACFLDAETVDEARLREIEKTPRYQQCLPVRERLKVNFARHTLITYPVRGDCHVAGSARVFRKDKAKKYTVRIEITTGGCRAAGRFQKWFVIEKIPPGYGVDFVETFAEKDAYNNPVEIFKEAPAAQKSVGAATEKLPAERFDMKRCINVYGRYRFVIKDWEAFLKTIRNDASRDWCLKNLEKIDFDKYSLLGLSFSSGYCRTPLLTIETIKDTAKKQYIFTVRHPISRVLCRHVSSHSVWALVPKIPDEWDTQFEVKAEGFGEPLEK